MVGSNAGSKTAWMTAIALAVFASGCGTLLHGTTSQVSIATRPTGAHAWVDGLYVGVTPIRVEVPSREAHTLVVRADGHRERVVRLQPRVTHALVVLDASWLFGLALDAMSGGWTETHPSRLRLRLDRMPPQPDGTHGHADSR